MSWISSTKDGVSIQLKVVPRGSRNRVEGLLGDALKVRLQAPPVDGKANKALIKFLAKELKVANSHIRIISGETGRNKRVEILGLTEKDVQDKLCP
jgi:hypothetical protein